MLSPTSDSSGGSRRRWRDNCGAPTPALASSLPPACRRSRRALELRRQVRLKDSRGRSRHTGPHALHSPTDIPIWEGLKLACNYSGVLLAALDAADPEPGHPPAEPTELRSSLVRLAYRLGDLLILLEGRYHHLLSRRRALLPTVRAFEELDEADRRLIVWGYEEKLRPQAFWTFDPDETMTRLFPLTEALLRHSLRHYLGCAEPELPALLGEYRRGFPASPPARSSLRQLGACSSDDAGPIAANSQAPSIGFITSCPSSRWHSWLRRVFPTVLSTVRKSVASSGGWRAPGRARRLGRELASRPGGGPATLESRLPVRGSPIVGHIRLFVLMDGVGWMHLQETDFAARLCPDPTPPRPFWATPAARCPRSCPGGCRRRPASGPCGFIRRRHRRSDGPPGASGTHGS